MRLLPAGVTIITAGRERAITGLTASSFVSVSLDPPSVLVCINRSSSAWPLIERRGVFGVNILAADQSDVAERFSGKTGLDGADRFEPARWTTLASGVPILRDAAAALDCEVQHLIWARSHMIVVGHVLEVRTAPATGALAYWNGTYVAIDRDEIAKLWAKVSLPQGTSTVRTTTARTRCGPAPKTKFPPGR
jgi:flavin reductase (DIM6/NTAB) family NADH-FMN oxidoreductase RutF